MALPIKWSLPSLSEITSPSAGFPKTLSTSLENTQSCPCKIRARGLTTIPAIEAIQRPTSIARRPTLNVCKADAGNAPDPIKRAKGTFYAFVVQKTADKRPGKRRLTR